MASRRAIDSILSSISANYGKHPKWSEEVRPTWSAGLNPYSDRDVLAATKRWVNDQDRPPTVANIRNTMKGLVGEVNHRPSGCSRCDGTGCVEIAHHTSGKKGQATSVKNVIAGCDCPAGERLCAGAYQPWRAVVENLRRDPYTLFVYHSEPKAPTLSPAQRMSPETLQRLTPSMTDPKKVGSWRTIEFARD